MGLKLQLPKTSAQYTAPTEIALDLVPGDFILTESDDFFGKLISFGQRLRFKKVDNLYTRWTHAALIVSANGDLVEAVGKGVRRNTIEYYTQKPYIVVHTKASYDDQQEIIAFANACLDQQYGWSTIISIALSLLTGLHFSFGFDGQEICSGLVARALERSTAIFPRDPSHITPADLALFYIPNSQPDSL